MPKITIELHHDGWRITVDNRTYHWDHDNPDLGTGAIAVLLHDLGYEVEIEEAY